MSKQPKGREYFVIPTETELADSWQQYRDIIMRRSTRGQFTEVDDGSAQVSGFINADQLLARNPHIQQGLAESGANLADNISAGRLSPDKVYELGARYILEMFAIATTAYEANQIVNGS